MKKYLSMFIVALFVGVMAAGPLAHTFDFFQSEKIEQVQSSQKFSFASYAYAQEVKDQAPAVDESEAEVGADSIEVPDTEITEILYKLATEWKSLGTLGILVLLTLLTVQGVKQFMPSTNKYKRLTVTVVSIIWAVLSGMALPGSNVVTVLMTVLISGGGAVALFEALKGAGILKK